MENFKRSEIRQTMVMVEDENYGVGMEYILDSFVEEKTNKRYFVTRVNSENVCIDYIRSDESYGEGLTGGSSYRIVELDKVNKKRRLFKVELILEEDVDENEIGELDLAFDLMRGMIEFSEYSKTQKNDDYKKEGESNEQTNY